MSAVNYPAKLTVKTIALPSGWKINVYPDGEASWIEVETADKLLVALRAIHLAELEDAIKAARAEFWKDGR